MSNPVACLLLLILLATTYDAVLSVQASNQAEDLSTASSKQQASVVRQEPMLIDFDHYKLMFNKKYGSRLEIMARKFFYYATLFQVYVSGVAFKFRQASSYLAVNKFSDWSRRELDMMENKVLLDKHRFEANKSLEKEEDNNFNENKIETIVDQLNSEQLEEVANKLEDEAKQTLGDVSEHDFIEPKRNKRRKRDLSSSNQQRLAPKLTDQLESVRTRALIKQTYSLNSYKPFINPEKKEMFRDLRKTGCVFPPEYQGRCGCCYAFAAITMAEFYYCKATKNLVKMSEQYLIDCGKGRIGGMKGCNGGSFIDAANFIHNLGLELALNRPYAEEEQQCHLEEHQDIRKTGHIRMKLHNTLNIDIERWTEKLAYGPILVSVNTHAEFHQYGGGVYDGSGCGKKKTNHGMVIVGYGHDYGQEFWLLKNSYGVDWGEQGYFRLAKEATKQCITDDFGLVYASSDGAHFNVAPTLNKNNDEVRKGLVLLRDKR